MLEGCVAWPAETALEYRARGCWQDITLFEQMAHSAQAYPHKVALIDGSDRRTYADLLRNAEMLAARLYAIGLRPLDRIVFQLSNSITLVESFFALMRIGAIPVMALPAHRQTEITHFVRASGAVALMVPDVVKGFDYRVMAQALTTHCPSLRYVLVDGTPASNQIGLAASLGGPQVRAQLAKEVCPVPLASEVALMLLSGGTTGLSKLIPRTHSDYLYGVLQSAKAAGFDATTIFLALLPMAHNYTLGAPGVLGALANGATTVIASGTAADVVFPLIERERVTVVSAAVPLVPKWLDSSILDIHDLSSLKVFMCGGAKLVPELRKRVEEKFRCTYQESFGTAEGLLCMSRLDDPPALRLNSSGRPVSDFDEIKIVGSTGEELADGEPGELLVRGPYSIRGYYDAPEINATAFTSDGFYRTGDVARKINGYLYVEGRIKDLINRGGEKISCEEVENHLLAHPKIESACVVAIPDDVFTEKACAVVILRKGFTLSLNELRAFLETRDIARFKMPERLEVVDEFPISPAGKILRRDLRAALAAGVVDSDRQRGSVSIQATGR
jgi:2,3-dihydroxybenzoate-AMP ligase